MQGILNQSKLAAWIEAYGTALRNEAEFTQDLLSLGVGKVRHVIREAVSEPKYKQQLDEERLSFLRTKALYTRCMEVAAERYGWTKQGL